MNSNPSLLSLIQAIIAELPTNKDDEAVVDALVAKRTAEFKTRPIKKDK